MLGFTSGFGSWKKKQEAGASRCKELEEDSHRERYSIPGISYVNIAAENSKEPQF